MCSHDYKGNFEIINNQKKNTWPSQTKQIIEIIMKKVFLFKLEFISCLLSHPGQKTRLSTYPTVTWMHFLIIEAHEILKTVWYLIFSMKKNVSLNITYQFIFPLLLHNLSWVRIKEQSEKGKKHKFLNSTNHIWMFARIWEFDY